MKSHHSNLKSQANSDPTKPSSMVQARQEEEKKGSDDIKTVKQQHTKRLDSPMSAKDQDDKKRSDSSSESIKTIDLELNRSHMMERGVLNLDTMSPRSKFVFETFSNSKKKDKKCTDAEWASNFGNNFADGEYIRDVYSCAIQKRILVQGKLYISNLALYFHSVFNDKLLLIGKQTKIKVPISSIKSVSKKSNAIIFDNSIEVSLTDGSVLFFTSFLNRNECYRIILKGLKLLKYLEGK